MGFDLVSAAYLGIALSTSSTLVVVSHLKQQQQMFEPFARLVIGVLLVQDLLMILVIGVITRWTDGLQGISLGLGGVVALGVLAVVCQHWVLPFVVARLKLDEECLLLLVLALLFLFAALANRFGLPPVTGAFLAGFALARFPINGMTRGLLLSISDFFQAIFFITLGTLIVLPGIDLLLKGVLLAVVVVAVTPPLVALLAEWQGLTSRPAVESGLLLAQTSEFALVLGLTGSQVLGQISSETFSMIALVAVATMCLTPFIATDRFTTFLLRFHPLRRRLNQEPLHKDHVLVLGFGAGGMWAVKPLLKAGHDVLVVDDDPSVIEQLRRSQIHCIRGDGADEKVLERAGARHAKVVIASMRRVLDAEKMLRRVGNVPVLVKVFEDEEAEKIRRLGGIPILNSSAAADTFMEWFEKTIEGGVPLKG
jgi:CPA2 family monovalent cation:H+ antiporter-2